MLLSKKSAVHTKIYQRFTIQIKEVMKKCLKRSIAQQKFFQILKNALNTIALATPVDRNPAWAEEIVAAALAAPTPKRLNPSLEILWVVAGAVVVEGLAAATVVEGPGVAAAPGSSTAAAARREAVRGG
jgi:hypothetical protein